MTKFLTLGVAIGVSFICFAAAQSVPLAPLEQAQAGLTIPVAGGCGLGFHRGPYGGCRRNGYYGGVYYGTPAVVAAPGVVVALPVVVAPGPCGGRGMHRVCNGYRCWSVCN